MKPAIILLSIAIFLVFVASSFYSQYCYMQYRNLWPKRDPVGLLARIRASLEFTHDPNDSDLSDECRKYFRRFKIAAIAAIITMVFGILFIFLARSFHLERVLDR